MTLNRPSVVSGRPGLEGHVDNQRRVKWSPEPEKITQRVAFPAAQREITASAGGPAPQPWQRARPPPSLLLTPSLPARAVTSPSTFPTLRRLCYAPRPIPPRTCQPLNCAPFCAPSEKRYESAYQGTNACHWGGTLQVHKPVPLASNT